MSHELVTLNIGDMNDTLMIEQCFVTSMYLYDETSDLFLCHLRYMMHKSPSFSFMYWIRELLFFSNDTTGTFRVTFPTNACFVMKETIPVSILEEYQNVFLPDFYLWNKACVPDFDLYVPYTSIFEFKQQKNKNNNDDNEYTTTLTF